MGGTEKPGVKPGEAGRQGNNALWNKLTKDLPMSEGTDLRKENVCFLCGAPNAALCKVCGIVAACSLHTDHHQVDIFFCLPATLHWLILSCCLFFLNSKLLMVKGKSDSSCLWQLKIVDQWGLCSIQSGNTGGCRKRSRRRPWYQVTP